MARVLISRLSSFGDVAMLVPVIFSVASRYPQDRFVVLTRKAFAPLFEDLGFNISAIAYDPKKHSGVLGLLGLTYKLSNAGYSHFADVHDVLRTKVIRTAMVMRGKKVAKIDKERDKKAKMISSKIVTPPLKSTIDRYMEVFEKLGFPADMIFDNYFEFKQRSLYPLRTLVSEKTGNWIGIAPFSKNKEKIYPLNQMEKVVENLSKKSNTTIFLFGSGAKEKTIIEKWSQTYSNVVCVAGKLRLENELLLMSYLDVMVSMDSANMHLASLVKIPVVSIWGATHPSLGFGGFRPNKENMIGLDNLSCRPCSVYGETPCVRGDLACLTNIPTSYILNRVNLILDPENKEYQNAVQEENLTSIAEQVNTESSKEKSNQNLQEVSTEIECKDKAISENKNNSESTTFDNEVSNNEEELDSNTNLSEIDNEQLTENNNASDNEVSNIDEELDSDTNNRSAYADNDLNTKVDTSNDEIEIDSMSIDLSTNTDSDLDKEVKNKSENDNP